MTTAEILEEIQHRGFTVTRKPDQVTGKTIEVELDRWSKGEKKFAVVSCTHLGSNHQQLTALGCFYKLVAQKGINTVLHAGDLVDGEKMYRGQEYETFRHGVDAQVTYAVNEYPHVPGVKTIAISGNHDLSFQANAGSNVVQAIARQRSDIVYAGDVLAFINIGKIKVALMHGEGGVPYARSYKMQKIVEQLASENKPHFLLLGHYHVSALVPGYRNVESVQLACFQSQNTYLARKGLMHAISGLIVTFQEDKKGLASVSYEWIPFYETKKDDY